MSRTIAFPNKEKVETEATQWLSAIDRGLSDNEQEDLDAWLAESPYNGEVLVHFASHWDKMDMLSAVAKVLPLDPEHKAPLFKPEPKLEKKTKLVNNPVVWVATAAMVMLVAAINIYSPAQSEKPYYHAIYQTSIGELRQVPLPDGSELKLNTNTEVHIHFSAKQRLVNLVQGEAYFDVAKNQNAPFVANIDNDAVIAVGTAFNIERTQTGVFEVLVTEGKVRVEKNIGSSSDQIELAAPDKAKLNEGIYLAVGEQAIISPRKKEQIKKADASAIEADLAWHDGMLVFQGETLKEALKEINRYTALELAIEDSSIVNIQVGGYFKAGDTEQLLAILDHNFGIAHRQIGNKVLFRAKAK